VPRLAAVGVVVSDLGRAIDFYRRLGLTFPEGAADSEQGHVEAELPGGLRFMLDTEETIRSFAPEWSPPTGGHRIAVAFQCDSPEDVDRVHDELVAAGAESERAPWDAFWGQRYAEIKDPDGNVVDLFAPLG
jgi:uncharacterized glyoxalase superfamily protein PhnB